MQFKLPPIPKSLNTVAFIVMLDEYMRYRAEKRNKINPIGLHRLLMRLERWGERRAIAAIEWSMSNGWTGVFENGTAEGKRAEAAYDSLKRFAARGAQPSKTTLKAIEECHEQN